MDPVELLQRMIAIRSHSGEEAELAEFLVEVMSRAGFDAHVDAAGNAVGVRRGPELPGEAERELVLLGHMDTVPGDVPERLVDGLLYGRGAVDAKGPLAAFVEAVRRVDPAPGVRLTVVGAVEEEAPSSKGARFIAERPAPEACLIGEPSGWDALTLGYKGRLLVRYSLEQAAGHSAGPEGTVAERAVDFWNAVRRHTGDWNRTRERLFDQVLPTLQEFTTSSDGLRDQARAILGFRLPPDLGPDAMERELRGLLRVGELECLGREQAWSSPRTQPLARAFSRAVAGQGARARFKHKTGTSDMNVLGPVWKCPIAAYGPGNSLLDHAPDEHVEVAEYLRGIDVLAETLREAGYASRVRERAQIVPS